MITRVFHIHDEGDFFHVVSNWWELPEVVDVTDKRRYAAVKRLIRNWERDEHRHHRITIYRALSSGRGATPRD